MEETAAKEEIAQAAALPAMEEKAETEVTVVALPEEMAVQAAAVEITQEAVPVEVVEMAETVEEENPRVLADQEGRRVLAIRQEFLGTMESMGQCKPVPSNTSLS